MTLGWTPRYLYYVTWPCESENNLRAILTELHNFGAPGRQQDDLADGITLEEDGVAPREFAVTRRGHDFSAVRRGDIGEQREVLNQRRVVQSIAFSR